MTNAHANPEIKEQLKPIYASTKPRCAKIIQKWAIVHIEQSASSPMVLSSLLDLTKIQRKPTERRDVNPFGKKEYAVTGFDVSFFIMTLKMINKRIFC